MKRKSNLDRLARKLLLWLPVAFYMLRVANELAELVSKAVNYASSFWKLFAFVYAKREAGFRAF